MYLTATLPDDSVLITHFGVSVQSAKKPVSPSSAADIGDRLILSVRELDGRIADETVRETVAGLASSGRTNVNPDVNQPKGAVLEWAIE